MAPTKVAILGCGGFAREVLWALGSARTHPAGHRVEVVGFIDRAGGTPTFMDLPRWTLDEVDPSIAFICGIGGMPEIKQRAVGDALARGLRPAPPLVFEGVPMGFNVKMGDGTLVCAGNILTVDIELGRHVAINLDCTVGHDTVVGDWATISPGVHVSGRVTLGEGAYIGTAASIIEGVTIGAWAVVGAGAVVTKDVPKGSLVVGIPATVRKARREFAGAAPLDLAPAR